MTAYLGVATLCIVWNVKQPVSVAELLKFIITRELGKRRVSYLFWEMYLEPFLDLKDFYIRLRPHRFLLVWEPPFLSEEK